MIDCCNYQPHGGLSLASSVRRGYCTLLFLFLEISSPSGWPAWLSWWILHTQVEYASSITHIFLAGLLWDILCSSDAIGIRALSLLIQVYFLQVQRAWLTQDTAFLQILVFAQILCLGEMAIYWGELLTAQASLNWKVFSRICSTLLLWKCTSIWNPRRLSKF